MNTALMDSQMTNYWPLLNIKQKEAVLTIVKNLAGDDEYSYPEYSDEFKKELDARYDDYKNGGTVFSEETVMYEIQQIRNRTPKG